ncbi:hypothetical protein [Blastococcus sp. VKM Ac-2987]|uniref:hypothetical protein n=1 Tax=Blastococcus sp. VKM Ac-2987 TaxID=3004141 RepID=UPI0022AB59ED|nr:hypothetical protein [Blastococcus sp. VKM Ac-2987]MCZ2859995.1 hypothetical protein [Blastococcus sp. VKM Ac-2987]
MEQSFHPFRSEHLWHHRDFLIGAMRPQSAHLAFGRHVEQVPFFSFAAFFRPEHPLQR